MERIGVRELRQHASRYLARVRAGESIVVTDRGRPVARLVPVEDTWDDLLAAGIVTPPEDADVDIAALRLADPPPGRPLPSQRIVDDRADER